MSDFPPIAELLPHAGPMCLLHRVVSHEEGGTTCEAHGRDASVLALETGELPALVTLEHMAQCVAAHGGLLARGRGLPPRPGLLLGTRRLALHADSLPADAKLRIHAAPGRLREVGLSTFDCSVERCDEGHEGQPIAEARLNVYVAESLEALVGGGAS
ncbi:MAG: 3-hydroxylacyl-ACP dehydratase [Myxococcota bacterium]|nr:3-hydroxylacyl-ACP dehydratase [Myxococcota bacterium]